MAKTLSFARTRVAHGFLACMVWAAAGPALAAAPFEDTIAQRTLACTACHHFEWRRELLAEWAEQAQGYGMREFVRRNLSWLVGPRSLRRLAPALAILGPLAFSVPVSSFVAQIRAILDMDDGLRDELAAIAVPTLVMVGSQDVLTTQGDGEEIASLIPGAELAVEMGDIAHDGQ